jgi:hypothetical protein
LEHLSVPQRTHAQRRFLAIGFLDIDIRAAGVSMMVERSIESGSKPLWICPVSKSEQALDRREGE